MSRPAECSAYQQSDQYCCNRCGVVWDMNDTDPPDCKTKGELQVERNKRGMAELRRVAAL